MGGDNEAGLYGSTIASYASQPVATVTQNGTTTVVTEKPTPYLIKKYKSGSALPMITQQVQDDFDQRLTVGRDVQNIISSVSSPDDLFAGTQSLLLESTKVEHLAVGFAKPGIYTILMEFSDDDVKNAEIKVEVHTQRCFTFYACNSDERTAELHKKIEDIDGCVLNQPRSRNTEKRSVQRFRSCGSSMWLV